MWLLALEALGAFFIFVLIVWWTMFADRKPKQSPQKESKTGSKSEPTQD